MEENKNIKDSSIRLCDLATSNKSDEIKKLAQDPQYVCFSCGQVADARENLCNPGAYYEMVAGGISLE
jgi:hypothetical protein